MATGEQKNFAGASSRTLSGPPPGQDDRQLSPEAYRSQAGGYDQRTEQFQYWRELLVQQLPAGPGDTVLDIGCGTGLCLPLLHEKVGPTGTIIGVDVSEQMLDVAADRVAESGWANVQLIAAPVAEAILDCTADAVIFCAVHDVLQSPAALARIFDHLRPGAAVAAIGGKFPAPYLLSLRQWVTNLHAPFITDFTGFDRPWQNWRATCLTWISDISPPAPVISHSVTPPTRLDYPPAKLVGAPADPCAYPELWMIGSVESIRTLTVKRCN